MKADRSQVSNGMVVEHCCICPDWSYKRKGPIVNFS